MSKSKLIIRFAVFCLAAIIPILLVAGFAAAMPAVYDETFDAGLEIKYDRLRSVEGEKIIFAGGSSVAFGLDSEALGEAVGKPVVNFGLYAALGTKIMLDMSRSGVKAGDTVVIAPEMSEQTLSLYFNGKETWQALDSDLSMLFSVGSDNLSDLAGALPDYVSAKIGYLREGGKPSVSGVYQRSSFNEYGDISYPRPKNVMNKGYDRANPITLEKSVLSEEFAEYVNEYIRYCEKRGAKVYFCYPPMNEKAIRNDSAEARAEFDGYMRSKIECEFLITLDEAIMPYENFFDSNFHLNDEGVVVRGEILAGALNGK